MEVKVDIKGYRQLSEEEQAKINELKELGEAISLHINSLLGNPAYDKRWISIGKTHMQQGLMALIRSIAQPTSF